MATVSELVDAISDVTKTPRESVNGYARALLDAGQLPLSRGRSIASIEPIHVVRLLVAVALEPKKREVAVMVSQWLNLRVGGMGGLYFDKQTPKSLKDKLIKAEDRFLQWFDQFSSSPEKRHDARHTNVEIVLNWPEIRFFPVTDGETTIDIFREEFVSPHVWLAHTKRSYSISGQAIAMLSAKIDVPTGGISQPTESAGEG